MMTAKKALIVDDSKLAQYVLKRMLRQHRIAVDTAESAEEALGYLAKEKPHVIFMDHTMSGMDGLQALKVIKNNPDTATIPIMMYTSQDDGVYLSQARALGAVDILPKQLKPVELEQVLKKLNLVNTTVTATASAGTASAAANETATPIQFAANKKKPQDNDSEELSKLVRDAEAALEKETLKQFVQVELGKQQQHFANLLQNINDKLDDVAPQRQTTLATLLENQYASESKKTSRWWPLALCITLLVFGGLYWRLDQKLANLQPQVATNLPAPTSNPLTSTFTQASSTTDTASTTLLAALENSLNIDNDVPYGTPLLGDNTLQKLFNLVVLLNETDFAGEVSVVAHTGNFCLASNSTGELVIPAQSTVLSNCQVIEPISDIEQSATPEFRQFINNVNNDSSNRFTVSLDNKGSNEPITSYPIINSATTAGAWNQAAIRNRRVEFIFNESR